MSPISFLCLREFTKQHLHCPHTFTTYTLIGILKFVIGASNHRGYERGEFIKERGDKRLQTRDAIAQD